MAAQNNYEETVLIQYGGIEKNVSEVVRNVKANYIASGHTEEEIEELVVYIKPIDNRAYYVINGGHEAAIDL